MTTMIVVGFDVSDNRRLYRVARELGNFGRRVQKSVFECHLTPEQLAKLQKRLARIINADEDHVRYYPLCPKDVEEITIDGIGNVTSDFSFTVL